MEAAEGGARELSWARDGCVGSFMRSRVLFRHSYSATNEPDKQEAEEGGEWRGGSGPGKERCERMMETERRWKVRRMETGNKNT